MEFRVLATGSSGNCYAVRDGDSLLAVDCGLTPDAMAQILADDKLGPGDLDAILITHEHGDHAGELAAMTRAADCPVFMSAGTWEALGCPELPQRQCFDTLTTSPALSLGSIEARPVPVVHDAREPVAWTLTSGGRKLGILTDSGSVSQRMTEAFAGSHLMALEFNHDRDLLLKGDYPQSVKRRIDSDQGHLNNDQAADLLAGVELPELGALVALHISEKNNSTERVQACLDRAVPSSVRTLIMSQRQASPWLEV